MEYSFLTTLNILKVQRKLEKMGKRCKKDKYINKAKMLLHELYEVYPHFLNDNILHFTDIQRTVLFVLNCSTEKSVIELCNTILVKWQDRGKCHNSPQEFLEILQTIKNNTTKEKYLYLKSTFRNQHAIAQEDEQPISTQNENPEILVAAEVQDQLSSPNHYNQLPEISISTKNENPEILVAAEVQHQLNSLNHYNNSPKLDETIGRKIFTNKIAKTVLTRKYANKPRILKRKATQPPVRNVDDIDPEIRSHCRNKLLQALLSKCIPEGSLQPNKRAIELEDAIHANNMQNVMKYKNAIKSRYFNLMDKNNIILHGNFMRGLISADQLAKMNHTEMACDHLKNKVPQENKSPEIATNKDMVRCHNCNFFTLTRKSYSARIGDGPLMTFADCLHCRKRIRLE